VWVLSNVQRHERLGFDAMATGTKEWGGREGTWRDAQDGELGGNLIAQGSVDSVGELKFVVRGGCSGTTSSAGKKPPTILRSWTRASRTPSSTTRRHIGGTPALQPSWSISSSRWRRRCRDGLGRRVDGWRRFARGLPLHGLEVKREDGIQHRHEQQFDEGRHAQPADLRIAQRLPQRSAMDRQREQG
jgi:hypothetical protein